MDIGESAAWSLGYLGGPPTIKWYVNECGEVYDYDADYQEEHFPNDPHTAYDSEDEAMKASLEMWPDPSCDECGTLMEETADWCGECGNCKEHCQGYVDCPRSVNTTVKRGPVSNRAKA